MSAGPLVDVPLVDVPLVDVTVLPAAHRGDHPDPITCRRAPAHDTSRCCDEPASRPTLPAA
ncbi:hypothetical protein [Mycobacterium helveticum]|uniref:hypothetical protein n=1 Tax=Mycobacterium helveticum TaxID=2592811 RepID=UPI001FEB134B|nr:hypothetical protein [Mycobacterium helveticum]